jgi:glucose-6-phosphate dehydrogenase assembly protein OpcA
VTGAVSNVLSRVDRELRAMWTAPPVPGQAAKARACTMNLVVVAPTPDLARRWIPIVDDVLAVTPSRAIVVGLDPDGADGLAADATAVCFPGASGGPVVCSERVTLVAGGAVRERLASCVDALVATDVPTTLVWLGRVHADDPGFAPLARDASRVVLDSASGNLSSLAHVAAAARARPQAERFGVADLVWTRLAPWQELCARAFDELRLRPLAARVTRVAITQAGQAGAPLAAEGALLLGWLATSLGWRAGSPGLLRPDGARVHAQLCAESAATELPGSLVGACLDASGDDDTGLRCEVESARDGGAATWRLEVRCGSEARRIEQRVYLRASDPARLLERTLHRPIHDDALLEAVAWADELRGEELSCT